MRSSDVQRQIIRLLDAQCVYRLQWSRLAVLRMMQGKDPLVRYRAVKTVPPDCRDYAADSVQAEAMRQAEADSIQSAVTALRQALQAGSARQAELRQAEARRQAEAGQAAGNSSLPYGSALARQAAGSALLAQARQAGHKQDRSMVRGSRSRGIEARSMVPASDIARLTTPRSTDVQSSSVFFRSTAGTDYSLSAAMRRAGTLDDTICTTYRDGRRKLSLKPAPKPALWTKRQAGKTEIGKPVVTESDSMQDADGRHDSTGGRERKAQPTQDRRHGSKMTQIASADCLAALEARQAARRK